MAKRTKLDTKTAHPLDIPAFLRRSKNDAPRDETEIRRLCERAEALRADTDIEDHDPRLVDMARRGLISRSVLRDPQSIVVALADVTAKDQRRAERLEKLVSSQPETPKRTARPDDHVTANALAETLKIDAKLLRRGLRALKIAKPEFGWAFPKADVPTLTKRLKAWLKAQEKK